MYSGLLRLKKIASLKFFCTVLILLFITSNCGTVFATTLASDKSNKNVDTAKSLVNDVDYEKYASVLDKYKQNGYKPTSGIKIILDTSAISESSNGDIPIKKDIGSKSTPALNWSDKYEWFEWNVDVPKEGLYEIGMEYYPLDGTGSSAQRALMIDGKVPFEEANNIAFPRMWKDDGEPKVNNIGDEVWSKQVEIKAWKSKAFEDNEGMYSEPFSIYLSSGKHTLRLTYVDQPMAVGNIVVKSPETIPTYEQIKAKYKESGYKNATQSVKFQAEKEVTQKSDPTIRRETNGDPNSEPRSIGSRKLNIMGDKRWKRGEQLITWKFQSPEDGLYKIDLRVLQNYSDGLPSYRQIEIDGKVPFAEMEAYSFVYENDWRNETLKTPSGEPYLFYFPKGEHELTMTVKMGPVRNIVQSITEDTVLFSEISRKIIMITGNNPDPNYEYELDRNIPGLIDDLKKLSVNMNDNGNKLKAISSKVPSMANNFSQIRDQLNSMIQKPDTISKRTKDIDNAQTSLGSYITSLQSQPLAIDYFEINPPEKKVTTNKTSIFKKIATTWTNFIRSFTTDYDSVGSVYKSNSENNTTINVWISRGKEWAEIMKEMADEDFTQKTGIQINMNILPAGQLSAGSVNTLLLSIASGKAPDVALGLQANSPVEFAIRDSVEDLSKFSDYSQVSNNFYSSVMVPFEYNKGVYALPETMDFTVLFYRKDIMKELNLKIPNTWNELYEDVLPRLYENGMDFYYPHASGITPLLFQNGGEFYNKNGTKSALDSPEALKAFQQWTDMNTNYGIQVDANFFTRMRNGSMPIGIASYSHYMQMATAAPELFGRWDIAPVPGIKKADGTVDRSVGSITGQAGVIMSQSKHKKEAWEFLKWWTSTEVQARYGKELESLLGVEARWNTANKDAFVGLPWSKTHLQVIMDQLKWAKEQPVVLGGYFTSRHITNAWNRVVLENESPRDSLEQAVKDINKELRTKQEEYGYKWEN